MTEPGYFVGLGSNLQPERNIPAILKTLIVEFGAVRISPVIRTRPVGIPSRHDFLNAVAFVETGLPAGQLKAFFNRVEERLGRDRGDSARQTKDRPADLDILLHYPSCHPLEEAHFPSESFLRPPFLALCKAMGLYSGEGSDRAAAQAVTLVLEEIEFGRRAQLLYTDGMGKVRSTTECRGPVLR